MSGSRKSAPSGCNLLVLHGASRRLFQFQVSKGRPEPAGDLAVAEGAALPEKAVGRDWRFLLRPRLDLAWLPMDTVFIRTVELPACDPAEVAGMVEFQIERISPMPPAQVVWTVETVPHADGGGQTAVVTLAARSGVDAFIGDLESGGYVVDALVNPLLRELLDSPAPREGLHVLAETTAAVPGALVAWWTGGILREVAFLHLPGANPADALVQQIQKAAWAAEAEGWLTTLPPIRLFGEAVELEPLRLALQEWSGTAVACEGRVPMPELAARTARHALKGGAPTMVADEVRERQRRQFVDTLWVKGLTGLAMTYLAGVFVYLAVLTVQKSRLDTLRDETRGMAVKYTNTLQLKARVRVLQEQVALRFAALDCWNAVAERLPETLNLTQMDFKGGRILSLDGTAMDENRADVTRFNSELKTVMIDGKPLFSEVKPAMTQLRGAQLTWRFEAELRREDSAP